MGISAALGSSALLPAGLGFRNKIINGNMVIAQRGTSPVIGVGFGLGRFSVDRWILWNIMTGNTLNTVTFQQSTIAPPGYSNSLLATVTATVFNYHSSNYTLIGQYIEGYNVADLAWGTASAKPIVLSFWARSSVTGTYNVALQNDGYSESRSYVTTFVINAANTWEYKTIYVNGETSGTWMTDNTTGLQVLFILGTGTLWNTTANTWVDARKFSTPGAVGFAKNSGATFYITGVQLEQNYQPTPFEQRPIGVELALCQRYYQRVGTTASDSGQYMYFASGWLTGSVLGAGFPLRVDMRSTPAVATSGVNTFYIDAATGSGVVNALATINHRTAQSIRFQIACAGTAGQSAMLLSNGTATAFFTMDAEL